MLVEIISFSYIVCFVSIYLLKIINLLSEQIWAELFTALVLQKAF